MSDTSGHPYRTPGKIRRPRPFDEETIAEIAARYRRDWRDKLISEIRELQRQNSLISEQLAELLRSDNSE